jgi:hypothetical protein
MQKKKKKKAKALTALAIGVVSSDRFVSGDLSSRSWVLQLAICWLAARKVCVLRERLAPGFMSSSSSSSPSSSPDRVRPHSAMDDAQVIAVLGAQWGDEGKGKLVDYLGSKYDICARFNGGKQDLSV